MKNNILSQNLTFAGVCLLVLGCTLSAADGLSGAAPRALLSWTTSGPLTQDDVRGTFAPVVPAHGSALYRFSVRVKRPGRETWANHLYHFAQRLFR